MGFYAKHILPHVIDLAMRNPAATRLRAEWIPRATGDVLEIGIGSGLNLPFYTGRVRRVYGLDPSPELQRMARQRSSKLPFAVEFLTQPAESAIPLSTESIDTVVLTWTLCSVAAPRLVLDEIRRVMKTNGRLIFVEHGRSPEPAVRTWQNRLTPIWRRVAGGCHLNREVSTVLYEAGYEVIKLDVSYLPGPRFVTYTSAGIACRVC